MSTNYLVIDELLLDAQSLEWELEVMEYDDVFDTHRACDIINELFYIEESLKDLVKH